jgi:hypothetical protein
MKNVVIVSTDVFFSNLCVMLCRRNTSSAVSVGEVVCISQWYLRNQVSIRDRFNVSKSSVLHILCKVCSAISSNYRQFIKWPKGRQMEDAIEEFEKNAGFPGQCNIFTRAGGIVLC